MGCVDPPKQNTNNTQLVMDTKIQIKLKIAEVESKINAKNKEIEKYKESAKFHLKNGNKSEAKRQLKKKQFNQKIAEKLQSHVQILDDQMMVLENTEVNQDIAQTLKTVNEKIKQATGNIDIRELEKAIDDMEENREKQRELNEDFNEALNRANDEDPDISAELEQLEAEMNNLPKANTEKLAKDTAETNKVQQGNLVFY